MVPFSAIARMSLLSWDSAAGAEMTRITSLVVFFTKSMNDQWNRTRPYGCYRYPTFFEMGEH